MQHLVVLSGSGISAESGLKTFRDNNGLWENQRVEDVATPEAWESNPGLVLEFYNQRRKDLYFAKPNKAHFLLAKLEEKFSVSIITQNVDDLHEQAGSSHVVHLHGELKKARSTVAPYTNCLIGDWQLNLGDICDKGSQLRPDIVWFGEAVPEMDTAIPIVQSADILLVIGTSLNVYPAANLVDYCPDSARKFLIDPAEVAFSRSKEKFVHIKSIATAGMQELLTDYLT